MAKTDIPVKRLMQLRPEDWIKAVTGEVQNISFSEVKPDKNPKPKTESRLDNLYEVKIKDKIFLLNIEPQGYPDPALPARMLRYRADIYESLMSKNHKILPINQTVIYFSTSNKITDNKIIDSTFKTSSINYSYEEIGVWDMDKYFVIENKLYGLYPLLPLMKDERKATDREIVFKECIELALAIEDEALSVDVLASMTLIAEVEYPKKMISRYVRREQIMASELWKEWFEEDRLEWLKEGKERGREEGREEGRQEGRQEGLREGETKTLKESVISLLAIKFGKIPEEIKDKIADLDTTILKIILTEIFRYESIDDIRKYLD